MRPRRDDDAQHITVPGAWGVPLHLRLLLPLSLEPEPKSEYSAVGSPAELREQRRRPWILEVGTVLVAWRAWTLLARGCLHSAPPTIGAKARRLSSAAAVAHVIGSASSSIAVGPIHPPQERKHERRYVRRSYCRAQVGEATATSTASGGPSGVSIVLISPLVFSPWKTPRRQLASIPQPEVIKKLNRNGGSLADSPRKSTPPITATCVASGIVTAKARNSMARASRLPPTRPLALSSSLGGPAEISMKQQPR